jgi:hypothetical protein
MSRGVSGHRGDPWAPKGVDPQASPYLAQIGKCLAETGGDLALARVDCADPTAAYRVLECSGGVRHDHERVCSNVPGVTATFRACSVP